MPELKFHSLECHIPQDSAFSTDISDEVYIVANGKRVWGVKSISANEIEDLSNLSPIEFHQRIRVDLYDKDVGGGPYSSTDHLGGLDIQEEQAGKGVLKHELSEKGARYTLRYEVK